MAISTKKQKELKAEYAEIVKNEIWPNSADMQNFEVKKSCYIVELSNGDIISIDKPDIQKDFCFGYGYCGVATDNEMRKAENLAEQAAKDESYFIERNMNQIYDKINDLKDCQSWKYECYTYVSYRGQPDNSKLKEYSVTSLSHNIEYEPWRWLHCRNLKSLGTEDIQLIIDGLQEVAKDFEKRLHTYLKRYGLSKVTTWSYLCD